MRLIDGEQVVLESNERRLVLTTHRLRYLNEENKLYSVMLEEISSCQIWHSHHPGLIVFALIVLVTSLVLTRFGEAIIVLGFCVFLFLLILYLVNRKSILTVTFSGGCLNMPIKRLSFKQIEEFIDELEKAKNQRFLTKG